MIETNTLILDFVNIWIVQLAVNNCILIGGLLWALKKYATMTETTTDDKIVTLLETWFHKIMAKAGRK